MTDKIKLVVALGIVAVSTTFASLQDQRNFLLYFLMESEEDCLVNGRSPFADMTFTDRYGRFFNAPGWNRERFFRELDALVSNGCSRAYIDIDMGGSITARVDETEMSIAVTCLCHADSNEWITCSGWLLTNGVDKCARAIGELYLKRYGLTEATLSRYFGIMSNAGISLEKKRGIVLEAVRQMKDGQMTGTNHVIRLIWALAENNATTFGSWDTTLCKFWQGYASSSNRYVNIQKTRNAYPPGFFREWCDGIIRELAKHQPLPLLPTNTINGVAW